MTATLITKEEIQLFSLLVLRKDVKLECLGMKCRGMSATTRAKRRYKLPSHLKSIEVLAHLDYAIGNLKRELYNR